MFQVFNHTLPGKNDKPIVFDYGYLTNGQPKPVVLFAHGFKGFKDWGHFNKVMQFFIEEGFVFAKFNFSHNGGTLEQPIDFPDLEAFGNNNYSKELDDVNSMLDWITTNDFIPAQEIDRDKIYLIGHSRGGGISILAASEDERIKKVVTWAAVADFMSRLPQDLNTWKETGVHHIANARTKQDMPMYYQFAEDLQANADRLNIQAAEARLSIPHLIIHGSADEAVNVSEAHALKGANPDAQLEIIAGAGHTFGAKHPDTNPDFPGESDQVMQLTLDFLKR